MCLSILLQLVWKPIVILYATRTQVMWLETSRAHTIGAYFTVNLKTSCISQTFEMQSIFIFYQEET